MRDLKKIARDLVIFDTILLLGLVILVMNFHWTLNSTTALVWMAVSGIDIILLVVINRNAKN